MKDTAENPPSPLGDVLAAIELDLRLIDNIIDRIARGQLNIASGRRLTILAAFLRAAVREAEHATEPSHVMIVDAWLRLEEDEAAASALS